MLVLPTSFNNAWYCLIALRTCNWVQNFVTFAKVTVTRTKFAEKFKLSVYVLQKGNTPVFTLYRYFIYKATMLITITFETHFLGINFFTSRSFAASQLFFSFFLAWMVTGWNWCRLWRPGAAFRFRFGPFSCSNCFCRRRPYSCGKIFVRQICFRDCAKSH